MKTILLIEDNADIRENMGEILELANYTVLLAADGRQGIAMALAGKPDLIVCDIMMPGLDGYGVLHLLHKHDDMRYVPFIFITAMAERSELRKGMDLGADDYITKPFTGTELLNAIEGRLQKVVPAMGDDVDDAEGQTRPAAAGGPLSVKQAFEAEQTTQLYHKKQPIYTEGHRAFRLYQVLGGKVKIFKTNEEGKELIVTICGAGDYFGYHALLEGAASGESAEALEEATEVASISREAFQTLVESPAVAQQFIRLLAGNVREKETQLLGLAYNSLRKKVAEALIMLHHKFEAKAEAEEASSPTIINISRENMAAIAGTAKESLIRTLGDFRDEGLIALSGSHVTILEQQKLSRLFN